MAGIQSGLEQTIRFDLNLSEDNEKKTEGLVTKETFRFIKQEITFDSTHVACNAY